MNIELFGRYETLGGYKTFAVKVHVYLSMQNTPISFTAIFYLSAESSRITERLMSVTS